MFNGDNKENFKRMFYKYYLYLTQVRINKLLIQYDKIMFGIQFYTGVCFDPSLFLLFSQNGFCPKVPKFYNMALMCGPKACGIELTEFRSRLVEDFLGLKIELFWRSQVQEILQKGTISWPWYILKIFPVFPFFVSNRLIAMSYKMILIVVALKDSSR